MLAHGRLATVLKVSAGVLVTVLVLTLGASAYLYHLSSMLPEISVDPRHNITAQTTVVYAGDGSVLAEWHGEEDRTVVPLDQIPSALRDAVVAIEDERFYAHHGVDFEAILRALRANTQEGEVRQGGSTITQQLVKIMFTGGERTFSRKVREALLAYQLEAKTDKDVVLQAYLNTVYYGGGAYGVESAAQHYFGAPASSLDLAQSATLAAVLRSPAKYSPIDAPDACMERRNLVLSKMREQGYISAAQEQAARAATLELAPAKDAPETAPYFLEYVKRELIDRLGADAVFKGGLRVYTTLDPGMQKSAEAAGSKILNLSTDPEFALVALNYRNGQVLAMVGGREFATNQFNLAVQGRRQPGSAFKPFVLVRALEEGVKPDDTFDASPYSVAVKDGTWNVRNYENQQVAGRMTLRAATNWSVNCVFARLIMKVGAPDVVDVAKRMGITSPVEPNPAIALGGLSQGVSPLEMASAYGTLGNGGAHVAPTGIVKVVDDEGQTVYEPDVTATKALEGPVAVQAGLMLHDVVESGTGMAARIPGVWAAGKTGTTQSYRDAWFTGYAEGISCSVWVGYRKGQVDMVNVHGIKVTGGSFPAQIWRTFMQPAIAQSRSAVTPGAESQTATSGPTASRAVLVSICPDSMLLANKRCPNPVEIYLEPDMIPRGTCTKH